MKKLAVLLLAGAFALPMFVQAQEQKEPSTKQKKTPKKKVSKKKTGDGTKK